MVLRFYDQPIYVVSSTMSVLVIGKKVNELFGRASKNQQHRQPYRKDNI